MASLTQTERFIRLKNMLKVAKSHEEITELLGKVCDLMGYHWNRERSYVANARIAELGLMSGVAICFRLADTRLHEILGVEQ